jgi:hypothetical protein
MVQARYSVTFFVSVGTGKCLWPPAFARVRWQKNGIECIRCLFC